MRSLVYILTAGVLWGIISIFVSRLQAAGFASLEVVALRALSAAGFLFIWILCRHPSGFRIELRDILVFLGTGIGSIVFFNYCYFHAIQLIGGAAVPALLLYTAPAFVLLLSAIFFKERVTKGKALALLVILFGLSLVTGVWGGGEAISLPALLLGLGSGLGYALYSIFGKSVVGKYRAETITFYTFLVAAIASTLFSSVIPHAIGLLSPDVVLSTVCLGLFCTALPFFLYTAGLSGMEAGRASLAATIEPVAAALTGVLYFGERISPAEGIGMLLVLLAILSLNLALSRK